MPSLLLLSIFYPLCLPFQSPDPIPIQLASPKSHLSPAPIFTKSSNRNSYFQMRIRASKTPPLSSISNPNPTPLVPPPLNSPPSNGSSSRCEGLDLLVLAVIEVFGDRALEVEHIGSNGVAGEEEGKQERIEKRKEELDGGVEAGPKRKRRKRQLAMPSRFQDSVLQPWKRRTRRRLGGAKRSS